MIDNICCYSACQCISHKILNYSVCPYLISNIIHFYLLLLQKGVYSLRMFLYIAWKGHYYFRIIMSN
ncbi:hypothetical protein COM96_10995 [Bacillus cereus]|uniref:Uncharacterized protein n=1 Tax=Bacillus cereus TaxID=1396 RepID=A0A2A7HZB1_BACCE|nr:hypothetical protein COM96_10995 [Bacillus cereus]